MAAAATALAPYSGFTARAGQPATEKPNSNFGGVQIGTITYSFRSMPGSAEALLGYLTQCGISSTELMGGPAEGFAGAPTFEWPRMPRGQRPTQEQIARIRAQRQAHAKELRKWRLSASMDKFEELRGMYEDAGVNIYIIKFSDLDESMPDDEIEYCFNVAKVLGARGITTEISEEKAKRLAPFADRHKIVVGFHNHTQVNSESWEKPFSYGKQLAMNFDVGHYVAGTNESPIPLIKRYGQNRILSLHIKDRKVNDGLNLPFGYGDTPIALILQLMKREKYPFEAHIELEYPVPEGSDAVAEVKKCVEFCRTALA
jgi:sugar phosphate isomerase/epimerase